MGLYTKIAQELIDRMKFHTGAGQILAGMKFYEFPEVNVEGLKDFPNAMLFLPSIAENYRPNIIGETTMRFNLSVSVERTKGIPELMGWVEKVLDAIETQPVTNGRVDTNLKGTTSPFSVQIANSFALDLSLTAQITITVSPKPMNRGSRRTS